MNITNKTKKIELQKTLSVLGKEKSLDILSYISGNRWSTATEIANDLEIHVATAVKHLQDLEDVDILASRTRKGKTRSALEYDILKPKFFLEIDITSLGNQMPGQGSYDITSSLRFLGEFSKRLVKLTGNTPASLLGSWKSRLDKDAGLEVDGRVLEYLEAFLDGKDTGKSDSLLGEIVRDGQETDILAMVETVLELEERSLGRFSLRSLAKISLDHSFENDEQGLRNSAIFVLLNDKYKLDEVEI
ncbi:MAG: helix-turn-helix transcriptional regulator [Thermoplasmata archaeon]|nr:helix-turn-helix transcriptional regulator [Thermoplasmata archaeon]